MKKTFVIGDVHGCLDTFDRLLKRIKFDKKQHGLWLVGDILNRGPDSLGMLRRAIKLEKKLGERFRMVLGNHELHLLGVAAGARRLRGGDTLDEILNAPDRGELLAWLRNRHFAYAKNGYLLVHAGLLPHWSQKDALIAARKLEKRLRKGRHRKPFNPRRGSRSQQALTRVRMLDRRTRICNYTGTPEDAPKRLEPWYKSWVRQRNKNETPVTVVFGHWAALGQRQGGKGTRHWISLDSGCVHGRELTALRLTDGKLYREPAR